MCYANAVNYISGNEDNGAQGLSADELSDVELDHSFGPVNARKIQQKCVAYTVQTLGTSLHDAVSGGKKVFRLRPLSCRLSLS